MKFLPALLALSITAHALEESPLRLIRTTEALTPAEEEKQMHVPEGFQVHLFASEPVINKPVNMAFDERGRMWVSSTSEYPYSAAKERWSDPQGTHIADSKDAIKILEDTDGDGVADKVTIFADGLNIPTGVLPWHKPEDKAGCIAWSIPNIWYFADTNGSGVCNKREILFGPLGYEKDTHGMCSSFRMGLDGWVYATHGFNNTSHFKVLPEHFKPTAPDERPDTLELHSGNVFRFRPDGSHIEIWSWGQVNPFGLCWDRYNNLYSADCHSNPLTQLIRGAYYPSFGKPDDGLGYGPVMCDHSHGSTGLCGVLYIDGGVWGPEWDDHMILGNCVTSKVNHDHITFTGTTPKAIEGPDFINSDDPWFRPVDLQLGPDSALYVADFYNRIIGHYEIPLDHPGRDRERGRIWRIVKKGVSLPLVDLTKATADQLVEKLDSPNLTLRRLAVAQLTERLVEMPEVVAGSWLKARCTTSLQKAYASWAAFGAWERTGRYIRFLGDNKDDFVDVHLLLEQAEGPTPTWKLAIMYTASCLRPSQGDPVPRTQLAAARALANCRLQDRAGAAFLLLGEASRAPAGDLTLKHTLVRTAREMLLDPKVFSEMVESMSEAASDLPDDQESARVNQVVQSQLRSVAHSLNTSQAALWLLEKLKSAKEPPPDLMICLGQAVRFGAPEVVAQAITAARRLTSATLALQIDAVTGIHNGLMESGKKAPAALLDWAADLAQALLALEGKSESDWSPVPIAGNPGSESPWCVQDRACADGKQIQVLSSLDQSKKAPEKLTGILRSKSFAAPANFSFWLCGHRGVPAEPAHDLNLVRLVETKTEKVLFQAFPPRSNVCQQVKWDLTAYVGKEVRFEIVDGDQGKAYAWLGAGRFEPQVLDVEHFRGEAAMRRQLRQLAEVLKVGASVTLRDRLRPYLPVSAAPPAVTTPEDRKRLDALIAARAKNFAKSVPDAGKGAGVFVANCAVCHQIKGQGGLIGPQLDGIGNRGVDRLMEDVLDPNRNVDAHFQLHAMKMLDGTEINGFVRGEVGQVFIVVDPAGQEHRVSKNEIKEDKTTAMSLMPPVFGQTIPEADFLNLIGYLMTKS